MSNRWALWFEELDQECNDQVGKKCANLGEMTKMGMRVPPGFALSLEAYKDFMSLTGADRETKKYLDNVGHDFENIQHFNEASAELRRIVESKDMPREMRETVLSHYQRLCQRCNMEEMPVSTRSAGAASHPGQYETHLNVRGDLDVIKKIKKVWSSTFNPRSLSARKHAGAPLETDPIGVAVLKMVNARTAGVLFTADPNTGDTSRMIIEANWGLGESVVGGEALPDTYILDKQSLNIIDRKLGTKSKYVAFKETGIAEMDTPTEKSCAFCLSDEEAEEIGRLGKVLESHFDVPQDAEWAVDQDLDFPESVILLQTRPEVIAQKRTPADQVVDLMLTRLLRR
ncbi:MAG: PEP/pyruvate-binding domain-containing protein [Deltaproteobacteria bacterium]|nr:MAG: PEP/pyruvate-binding domain-containing protein [Deltaproteobacteria bacterium]